MTARAVHARYSPCSSGARTRSAVITYPGMLHGFMRLTEAVAQAREAVAHAGEWLKEVGGMLPPDGEMPPV